MLILVLLGAKKVWLSQHITEFGADGGFFTNVAQNVRDGFGLSTNVSLFHKGYRTFPHPTSVYPLWPLVYGYLARFVDIRVVGIWLPTALYFVTLVLAYLWARRFWPGEVLAGIVPRLNAGHLLALMLGVNFEFFVSTSRPYTEGLAFALLFAALLRAEMLLRRLAARDGIELGLWLVGLLLVRSQFIIVVIAAGMALAWAAVDAPRRMRAVLVTVGATASFGAVFALYSRYLATFIDDAGLLGYLRFDSARAATALSQVPIYVSTTGPWAFLVDRLQGIGAAFGWGGASYFRSFNMFAYALPAALVVALVAMKRSSRADWLAAWSWLRTPENLPRVFVGLLALGGFASLHLVHKVYSSAWHFGLRQGLLAVFAIFLAQTFLLTRRQRFVFGVGVWLLAVASFGGFRLIHETTQEESLRDKGGETLSTYRAELVQWLGEQERGRAHGLTVAITRPEAQRLAWRAPGVNFHWLTETTTLADLRYLIDELGVAYVILVEGEIRPQFASTPEFARDFEPVASPPQPPQVFEDIKPVSIYRQRADAVTAVPPVPGGAAPGG